MLERRKEPRYPVQENAVLWDFAGGRARDAVVEDVSRSGLKLLSELAFSHGTRVAVDLNGMILCGTVQHCGSVNGRFVLGIHIECVMDQLMNEGSIGTVVPAAASE